MSLVSIPQRIEEKKREITALKEFPPEELIKVIKEVGFSCNNCTQCCTKTWNDHVFLLDSDTERLKQVDAGSIGPAPYFEFCDQNGTFYVSGYAVRSLNDIKGSCYFLTDGKCRIYEKRPFICRVYPYMLHREADESGKLDWRQISGLDLHGEYHQEISEDECIRIASEIMNYEEAFLKHEIDFLTNIKEFFSSHSLKHVQRVYDLQLKRYKKGETVIVKVFYKGKFEENAEVQITS